MTSLEDDLKLLTAPVPSHIVKDRHACQGNYLRAVYFGSLCHLYFLKGELFYPVFHLKLSTVLCTYSHLVVAIQRGESHKTWKNRFFKAYNAKDNYKVEYFDGTSDAGKLKGCISPCGYRAYEFNSDDEAEHGEPGIKLVPWSSRRRTWWIKCPDEQERKEWLGVFENACYKARPPRDEDDCIAEAFDITLRNLRWHYWFWGWYADAGDEGERLGEFILDLIDRNVLNAVIDNIVDGPTKYMTIDIIRKTVGTSVKASASSAWISSGTAVRSLSDSVKASAKELLGPLIEQQKNFKAMIVDKISGTVNPFMSSKGSEVLSPILSAIFKPVTESFVCSVQGFHNHMSSKIASNEFAPARLESSLDSSDWQMDWWSGPLHKGFVVAHRMYTSDLADLASLFVGGVTPYTVYNMVRDRMQLVAHRAVYTFGTMAKDVAEADLPGVLQKVTSQYIHDALIMVNAVITEVLKAVLSAPLTELVITPCKALVEPIQEQVDAIDIPGLPLLLDVNAMLEEVIDSIVMAGLGALVSGVLSDVKTQLDAVASELKA